MRKQSQVTCNTDVTFFLIRWFGKTLTICLFLVGYVTLSDAAYAQYYIVPAATGVASTDTTNLQNTLTSAAANGGTVYVPSGTYVTNQELLISSNTLLRCAPGSILNPVAAGSWVGSKEDIVINFHNASTTLKDHDITIEGCTADLSNWPTDGVFGAFEMHAVERAKVIRPTCTGGGAGCTRFLRSADTLIDSGYTSGANNACWDHWDSPTRGVVRNSYCSTNGFGILYTGTNTPGTSGGVATNGVFEGNTIVLNHPGLAGIWLQGNPDGSGASYNVVSHNYITLQSVSGGCIKVDGASFYNDIIDNICWNNGDSSTDSQAVAVIPVTTFIPGGTLISRNQAIGFSVSSANIAVIADCSTNSQISNNKIFGGTFPSAIRLCGSNQTAEHNMMSAGVSSIPYYFTAFATGTTIIEPDLMQSWTPVLQFGGGSTGIVYSNQSGKFWVNGKLVYLCGEITLTSKGTSVGNANVAGAPYNFTSHVTHGAALNVSYTANFSGLSNTPVAKFNAASVNLVSLTITADVASPGVTNANFSNNSAITFCGTYPID